MATIVLLSSSSTHGSTFSTAAYAMRPKPTWVVIEGGPQMGTCHLQASSEPVPLGNSPAILATIHSAAACFRQGGKKRMLTYPWVFTVN